MRFLQGKTPEAEESKAPEVQERVTVTAGVTSDGKRKGAIPAWAERLETARLFRKERDTMAAEMEGLSKYECKWGIYGFQAGSW